jgi:hypothetical protein
MFLPGDVVTDGFHYGLVESLYDGLWYIEWSDGCNDSEDSGVSASSLGITHEDYRRLTRNQRRHVRDLRNQLSYHTTPRARSIYANTSF